MSVRTVLEVAFESALDHLESLDEPSSLASLATLRSQLDRPLADDGVAPEEVVRDLARDVAGGLLASTGGRFFGWVIGGALPAALAADWLTTAWDQNAALYACAPAAAVSEEVVGRWLKDILGLPMSASFALVTGCQAAHVTCLAAARHALLAARGHDVERQGLFGAPRIRLLTSQHRHGSIDRAVRLLGLGHENLVEIDIEPASVAKALESDEPTILLLQAGDINTGAYDDFSTLVPIAKSKGAWVHVDGAFGLWAAASPRYRHLMNGAASADSWATDGHKWLNVPFDCGYAFVADSEAHRAALAHRAAYLTHDSDARDQIDWNPEWSRRARGFPTYAALRQLGRNGVAELIDRCCAHARALVDGIGKLQGAEVVWEPIVNQGLVRFGERTDDVIAAVVRGGEAFFTGSTWNGQRVMRVSVCNWRTTEHDVARSIEAVRKAL